MSDGQLDKDSKEYKLQREWLKKNKIKVAKTPKPPRHQTGCKMTLKTQGGD